jgi:hypothetical protein
MHIAEKFSIPPKVALIEKLLANGVSLININFSDTDINTGPGFIPV